MTTRRLVLFAHGSGDPKWRAPFERLLASMERELGAGRVALAYMEFVRPTLLDAAADAARDGISELRVLPLFMAAGAHVDQDIPVQAAEARSRFPRMKIQIMAPIGEDARLIRVIQEIARDACLADERPGGAARDAGLARGSPPA